MGTTVLVLSSAVATSVSAGIYTVSETLAPVAWAIAAGGIQTIQVVGESVNTAYLAFKENAPEQIHAVMDKIELGGQTVALVISGGAQTGIEATTLLVQTSVKLTDPLNQSLSAATQNKPKEAGVEIKKSVQFVGDASIAAAFFVATRLEETFNKEPLTITEVSIEEVGNNYTIVSWKTNHYATGKVNYGFAPYQWSK